MTNDFSPDPSFNHSNWDQIDGRDPTVPACGCFLCKDWFLKSAQFWEQEGVCKDHNNLCRCSKCLVRIKVRTAMIAAGMKRDIYSELSFLTKNENYRDEVLSWFLNFIKTCNKKDTWWAFKTEGFPLDYWLQRWHTEKTLKASANRNKRRKALN